jgi:hypothetical protein
MATKSFYESLVIETEEQGQAVLRAFEEGDKRVEKLMNPTTEELLARSSKLLREGYFDDVFL